MYNKNFVELITYDERKNISDIFSELFQKN